MAQLAVQIRNFSLRVSVGVYVSSSIVSYYFFPLVKFLGYHYWMERLIACIVVGGAEKIGK